MLQKKYTAKNKFVITVLQNILLKKKCKKLFPEKYKQKQLVIQKDGYPVLSSGLITVPVS